MRMHYFKWILLCTAFASIAMAGVMRVPAGPVAGKWLEGDSVIVDEGAYILENEELVIEGGVSVFFDGVARFEVYGNLVAEGDAFHPVVIYSVNDWRGIVLNDGSNNHLSYLHINPDAGLARQCVELHGGYLEMDYCNFIAGENCLRVVAGRLRAIDNYFKTTRLYSKVVELSGIEGLPSDDCGFADGNLFKDNFLKCEVAPLQPGQPEDPHAMTTGLWVDECTNICLNSNEITVRAPLTVVGIRFGNTPDFGDQEWELSHTIVYVESYTHAAIGILNGVDGDLDVSKMTIAVRGADGYTSTCFYAARTSYIRINSTTTIMGSPTDIFFNTSGAGHIDANYLLKWAEAGTTLDGSSNHSNGGATVVEGLFDNLAVNVGDSVWEADPQFTMVGEWGEWDNRAEIAAFFGLTQWSPCIDRGDPDLGYDPDNTRLDIGRFFFDQTSSPVGERPEVVDKSAMRPAYPNPFNPNTILPIELSGSGLLRVTVWDVLGRIVWESNQAVHNSGLQNVHFNASGLATGAYVAQAEFDGQIIGNQRLLLVK